MITGANTNVRYRGILFHVQTEDSGRANPHIISHVYHGGTILGSEKTDYSGHLETDDLVGTVRGLIDEQHAAMLAKLHSGGFDDAIAQRLGDTAVDAGFEEGADAQAEKPDTEPEAGPRTEPSTAVEVEPRPAATASEAPAGERAFGEGLGTTAPLDEVILDYLADKARGRSATPPGGAARKTRPGG